MATVSCARCGEKIPARARFCPACGAPAAEQLDERRVVTVVFADLTGFTALSEFRDPEEVKAIVDRAFARLGLVVERYGGRVDKVIGDELMAVFGAPEAHEDDPERAVRCAFAMRSELEALSASPSLTPLTMHVGINTGEVVAGNVGGRGYTILGDAVNTARRIQEAAGPGQILVGEATRVLTEHAVSYRPLDPIAAKGKQSPIPVAEAVLERGLPGRTSYLETPLIGRREEMHLIALAAMLAERDRRPYVVTIVGDAGMGKSKIAAEIASGAQRRGVGVLSGRSLPYATVSPSFALEQLVRGALDLEEAPPEAEQIRARLAELGLAGDAEPILAFLGAGHDPAAATTGGGPGAGAVPTIRRTIDACVRVLAERSRRDGLQVLVLNDLQWAEPIVLDALDLLSAQTNTPLLVVALARPSLLDEPHPFFTRAGSFVLPLAPLSPARADEVLRSIAPELPQAVREDVIARAGGNPFFLEELARLTRGDSGTPTTPGVPMTVQALVAARLDALAPAAKRLLQVAAIAGGRLTPAGLAAIAERDPEELSPVLDELVAEGFLERSEDGALHFRQKVVRDVAYGSLPKQHRVEAHERYGAWLQTQPSPPVDELAHTYESAALLARELGRSAAASALEARRALIALAERALGHDAAATARGLFERAIAVVDEPLDLDARVSYGAALVGVFAFDVAIRHLEQARADAELAGDRRNEGRALRLIGDSLRAQGHSDQARAAIETAIEIAREIGSTEDFIEAERARGLLDLFTGDYQRASDAFRDALERAEAAGDARSQGWALQSLGWTLMVRGRQLEAIEAFERGEAMFAGSDDFEGRGWCMGMRAWCLLMLERVDESVALMAEVEHLVHDRFPGASANLVMARRVVRVLHAYVAIARADLIGAEQRSHEILTEPEWHGQHWAHALAAYPAAMSALLSARADTAERAIASGREAASRANDPFYIALYEVSAAWLALLRGDRAEAARLLEALSDTEQAGRSWRRSSIVAWLEARIDGSVEALTSAAALVEEPGRTEGITVLPRSSLLADIALQLLPMSPEQALKVVAAARRAVSGFALGRVDALLADARVHLAIGDRSHAHEAVNEALEALSGASHPLAHAQALALAAEILDARREHDRADEVFEQAKARAEALPADTLPETRRLLRT